MNRIINMNVRRVQYEMGWGRSEGDALIRAYWWLNHYPDGVTRSKPRVYKVRDAHLTPPSKSISLAGFEPCAEWVPA